MREESDHTLAGAVHRLAEVTGIVLNGSPLIGFDDFSQEFSVETKVKLQFRDGDHLDIPKFPILHGGSIQRASLDEFIDCALSVVRGA